MNSRHPLHRLTEAGFSRWGRVIVYFGLVLFGSPGGAAVPAAAAASRPEDLNVMTRWPTQTNASHALYYHLSGEGIRQMQARSATVAGFKSQSEWQERRAWVQKVLREEMLGPLPVKAPLRARTTGVVTKRGYRIEKIIYDALPGFPVTAALFIPEGLNAPGATVIFASGHTADAFRNVDPGASYLRIVLNLVRKGFIVFAFDPLSQGERSQYFDAEKGVSRLGKASAQHSYMGMPPQLTNYSLALAMNWDGMRAVDYLATRSEVDMKRIGMCGNSGGGTQTAYVSAMDERIDASVPGNFITNYHRLLQTRGPQDPEQYLYRQLARGIDHADYLLARAPRPTLVAATTRDFFNIQGARETFAEARRAFAALGAPGNLEMVEDDFEHGYTTKTREATYAFFQKHLGVPGSPRDEDVEFPTPEEMQVTPTGQVATSLECENFFTVSRTVGRYLVRRLEERRRWPRHLEDVRRAARELSGYEEPRDVRVPMLAGRYQRDGYVIEKYVIEGEGDYPVPYLLFVPEGAGRRPAVIYLHPQGKAAEAGVGGELERLTRRGVVVLAPDLGGIGETAPNPDAWEAAMLTGRSLVAVRAGDVARLTAVLQARTDVDAARITGAARGELGVELIHAAAFTPALARIALVAPLLSYQALLEEEYFERRYIDGIVPRALMGYDLPDLAATLAPRPLLLAAPVEARVRTLEPAVAEKTAAVIRDAYAAAGAARKFSLQFKPDGREGSDDFCEWLAADSRTLAFPGAEGVGKWSRGGRGGAVHEVTNLHDSGPGSLRAAVEARGPRTVVFRVSGTIHLRSRMRITHPFITIAGQTAPGDGICLARYPLEVAADDVVVRHIRSRSSDEAFREGGGTAEGMDSITVVGGTNIIIDHCSATWSVDENLSSSVQPRGPRVDKVSVQWCIIGESLNRSAHSSPAAHGYGTLAKGGYGMEYSYHHNLYLHNNSRNPYPGNYNDVSADPQGLTFDFRNNVIYNWMNPYAGYNTQAGANSVTRMNFVGNYYKPGPNSGGRHAFFQRVLASRGYFEGNWMADGYPADPWSLVMWDPKWTPAQIAAFKLSAPTPVSEICPTEDAVAAYRRVIADVGATRPKRDAVDTRLVNDVITGGGKIIDDESEVGGWPELRSAPPPYDADRDGMPDDWERERGLDARDASDGRRDRDGDGYTNLEEYLNELARGPAS